MSFRILDIIVIPVVLFTVIFLAYFVVREMKRLRGTGFRQLLYGALVCGVGMGLFLSGLAAMVLPTYVFIDDGTSEGHHKRYVLNSDFFSECGQSYLLNKTSETFYVVAKCYGGAGLDDGESAVRPIPPGKHVVDNDIDDWFVPFPQEISSSSYGVVRRNEIRLENVEQELKRKVKYIYEERDIGD